jgi:hypothetical protein
MHGLCTGRHHFRKVSFKCQTPECGHLQLQGVSELMRIGAWPASASLDKPKRLNTFIDESVLKRWDLTTKHSPETSLQGFLRTVEAEGEDWGCGAEYVRYFFLCLPSLASLLPCLVYIEMKCESSFCLSRNSAYINANVNPHSVSRHALQLHCATNCFVPFTGGPAQDWGGRLPTCV